MEVGRPIRSLCNRRIFRIILVFLIVVLLHQVHPCRGEEDGEEEPAQNGGFFSWQTVNKLTRKSVNLLTAVAKASPINFDIGFMDNIVDHFIQQFRAGLIEANFGQLPIPDVSWTVDGGSFVGVGLISNVMVTGLTDFSLKNVSTSVIRRVVEVDVQVPLISVDGTYHFEGSFLAFPLWGSGNFSFHLVNLGVGGGAQLFSNEVDEDGTLLSSIGIFDPTLSVESLSMTYDGLFSNTKLVIVILISVTCQIVIILAVVFITLHFSKRRNGACKKYEAVRR